MTTAVWRRPHLWPEVSRLIPPGWWRRLPPRPWPPAGYVRFRLQTMYGEGGGKVDPQDVRAYLEWCRRMHRRAR